MERLFLLVMSGDDRGKGIPPSNIFFAFRWRRFDVTLTILWTFRYVTIENDHVRRPCGRLTSNRSGRKKGFSTLINHVLEKKGDIVVTKRGKPVAVIVPYDEYEKTRRLDGFKKIMESREVFSTTGLTADEVYQESKRHVEDK